jgi:hypothetical protein
MTSPMKERPASPPRVWINRTQFGNFDCIHAYQHKISDDHDEYVNIIEVAALLEEAKRQARAEGEALGMLKEQLKQARHDAEDPNEHPFMRSVASARVKSLLVEIMSVAKEAREGKA